MRLFLAWAMMLFYSTIVAQTTISGTITDKVSGQPLPFVSITSNTNLGTTTNNNGYYYLTITPKDKVLRFSFLGYKTQVVSITNTTIINVVLEELETNLNEVVVTALGLNRKTKELGYAVQELKAKDISTVKTPNFLDNLAGKMAGVTVSQGATGVGSSSKITIRGEASFSNNNPLFILDGTPINNTTVFNFTNEAAAGFQEIDFGNGAMEVNQDDIASVTVLKGPSAAALYGSRAANGVIVIKTKDGSKKKGLGISINSSITVDNAFRLPQFQNQYGQGNSGNFEFVDGLGGGINDNITYSWGPKLDAGNFIAQFDSPVTLPNGTIVRGGDTSLYTNASITPTLLQSNPNNLKDFYNTGVTKSYNIAINDVFKSGAYRFSLTDVNSKSIIPGVNLKRKTAALKLRFNPTKKTKISTSLSYVNSLSDNRPSNGYGSENANYSLVAWGPRSLNTNSLRNYWQPGLEGVQQYSFNYTFFDNPFFTLKENTNAFNRDRVFGNVAITHEFSKQLSVTVRSGMDFSSEKRRFKRHFSTNRFKNGAYAVHDVFYREVNTDILANYKTTLGNISIDVSLGANRLNLQATTTQTQTINLAQPGIFSLNNAASPIEVFEFRSKKRINAVYGLAKFGYKDYLFLDITGRNDWSSALATPFSTNDTSFFYPSTSASFVLSNVVKLPKIMSFAKLRASVAQVGNDTNPYQTSSAFVAQTPVNGQSTFSNQNTLPNTNLKPELTTSYEFGADIRFFKDRLNLDITYYNATTKDQIVALPIPISSGYNQQVVNGGKVNTQGVEFVLDGTPLKTKQFKWQTTFNFATYKSVIKALPQDNNIVTLAYSRIYNSANQTVRFQAEKGGQIGDMYGTGYQKNSKGEFLLDDNGRFIANNDLIKIGNYNPDFTLGISNTFTFKNISASVLLDWRQGGDIVSRTRALGNVGGQLAETANRPTEGIVAQGVNINTGLPNTIAVSAESYYRQFYDRNHEENNVYDASFLKLRQVALGYSFNLKDGVLGLKDGGKIDVSIIGNNLFVITENPHFDPEQLAVQGNTFISGVEDMSYASTRSFGLKASLNF